MCHVELIFSVRPGVHLKTSVIKMSWVGKDDNGKDMFKAGGVHLKRTDPAEWQEKYKFLVFTCDRKSIYRMFQFLVNQNNNKFNKLSYYAALTPLGWGTSYWHPRLMLPNDETKWYCAFSLFVRNHSSLTVCRFRVSCGGSSVRRPLGQQQTPPRRKHRLAPRHLENKSMHLQSKPALARAFEVSRRIRRRIFRSFNHSRDLITWPHTQRLPS